MILEFENPNSRSRDQPDCAAISRLASGIERQVFQPSRTGEELPDLRSAIKRMIAGREKPVQERKYLMVRVTPFPDEG
ncbi:hypothetical protein [Pelagibacterium sp. H642]|uniref:hypothetical protein n=1 Tax=Pelagibacterium sp. H642 TaxID=1881069 RepID=UPI00281497A3|nr:hypothetical protein [Pelagibacterium sp. H642]WMT92790.1 hypothetical protein NO934_18585 [Pelagibacterium sp. H642]